MTGNYPISDEIGNIFGKSSPRSGVNLHANQTGMELHMFARVFLDHPRKVDESYLQHMGFALWFAGRLGLGAAAALIHAVIPAACERTASTIIAELYEKTHNRGR